MLLNGSLKQTFSVTSQNPIAFMVTECKKLFLQAMTAITITVLNKKALAPPQRLPESELKHWDISKTNKSDKLWNITPHFPGKMLANNAKLVWIHTGHFLCSSLIFCFYFKSTRPIRQHMRETSSLQMGAFSQPTRYLTPLKSVHLVND